MNQSTDEKPVANDSRDDKQSLISRIVIAPLAACGVTWAKKAQAEAQAAHDLLEQEAQAELKRAKQKAQAEGDRIAQEAKDRLKTPAEDTA